MQIESFSFESALSNFKRINYKGIGNITLYQGDEPQIRVSSKVDFQDAIKYEVKDEELVVKVKDPVTLGLKSLLQLKSPDLQVEICFSELEEIKFNGMGNLVNKGVIECYNFRVLNNGLGKLILNLDAKNLYCKLDGAGSIEVVGSGEQNECRLNGAGKIDTHKFQVEDANVVAHGVGRVDVFASKKLSAKLTGVGTIRHYGNPDKIESKLQGVGSIVAGE